MPNINFPTSPALNDQYSFEGKTWTYNGVAWVLTSSPTSLRLDSAYGHANAAFAYANTISGGAAIDNVARATANSATILAQAAFDQANTDFTTISTTAGVYGNATFVPVITLAANGRISSITNTAISSSGATLGDVLALAIALG